MNTPGRSQSGFTIVELLIVVVVIAILAVITIVAYNGIQNRAKDAATQTTVRQAVNKITIYHQDNSVYPASIADAGLVASTNGIDVSYKTNGSFNTFCVSAAQGNVKYYYSTNERTILSGSCGPTDCPADFIAVPGNTSLSTSDFCVMKYEAKIVGQSNGNIAYSSSYVPESRASGTAWTNISQVNSVSEAQTACSGCHLITEAEWMTIVANVLSVGSNWSSGAVGSGYIFNGHGNSNPGAMLASSTDDTDGLFGITGGTGNGSQYNNRRTLSLTNNEVIWDLAGNTWEWTNATITGAQPGAAGSTWRQYPTISNWGGLPAASRPSILSSSPGVSGVTGWTSTNGIGQIRSNLTEAGTKAYRRGAGFGDAANGGVLTLSLEAAATDIFNNYGFRATR